MRSTHLKPLRSSRELRGLGQDRICPIPVAPAVTRPFGPRIQWQRRQHRKGEEHRLEHPGVQLVLPDEVRREGQPSLGH